MNVTQRTPELLRRAATRAAGVIPRHVERVTPNTLTEDELRRRMMELDGVKKTAFRADHKQTAAEKKRQAAIAGLTHPMTAKQIAEVIGISPDNMSRTLRELEAGGHVKKWVRKVPKMNPVNMWERA